MSESIWLWVLGGAMGLASILFWRSQDNMEKRIEAAEKRSQDLSTEVSTVREQIAREYHSKADLRDLLEDVVAPINRAIESLQRDFNDVLRKGWPGGGTKER